MPAAEPEAPGVTESRLWLRRMLLQVLRRAATHPKPFLLWPGAITVPLVAATVTRDCHFPSVSLGHPIQVLEIFQDQKRFPAP